MRLTRLDISRLRCLEHAEFRPAPGLNLITGGNGAGKTSLIEAVHLLAYGRSFRGRVRDGLIRSGSPNLELYAEWLDGQGRARRAGLRHAGNDWEARLDGAPAPSLTELCAELAVVTFEPGSHELIAGGAEHRRRFLDWALFHVEPTFLPVWRRYARSLKQRNALLKRQPAASALAPWDRELAESGELLSRLRSDYLDRLEQCWWQRPPNSCRSWGLRACASCPAGAATTAHWKTRCCCRANGTWRWATPGLAPTGPTGAWTIWGCRAGKRCREARKS